jgi:hypothetical protein
MGVYNGERYLAEALESILSQSFKDFECIIVDDGSTDRTPAILGSYAVRDARIQIVRQNNRGLTASLNHALRLARGRFVARMDADDVCVPDRFAMQVDFLQAHPDVGVLGGAFEMVDSTGKFLCTQSMPKGDTEIRDSLLDSCAFLHPSVMMRTESLRAVDGYRDILCAEDYDLWLRLAETVKLANLSQVLIRYRIHTEQISLTKFRDQAIGADAARLAAHYRRQGRADPFDGTTPVTQEVLEILGLSQAAHKNALARAQLGYARNALRIGQFDAALQSIRLNHTPDLAHVDAWIRADSYLLGAKLYWMHKIRWRALLCAARALWIRPAVLARPLRHWLRQGKLLSSIETGAVGT